MSWKTTDMRWLLNLFGFGTEPPPMEPHPAIQLDELATRITNEEFGGECLICQIHGIHEHTREIRTRDGRWLAEVGFDRATLTFYRAWRETVPDKRTEA